MSGKLSKIFTLVFIFTIGISQAQITLDCESGNIAIERAYCWNFGAISYTSAKSQVINQNFTIRSNSLTNPSLSACWIKTPWISANKGNITLLTKLENGTGSTKQLIVSYLPYDEKSISAYKEGNPVTFYTYDYPLSGKTFSTDIQKITIPIPAEIAGSGNPVKILFSFAGTGGSNRANTDDIVIPGEYISDPANGCLPIIKTADSDKDGVSDTEDQYPDDPFKAYNNYFPADKNPCTLAFEDSWPAKGDYDLNDLVVDYIFNRITNAANEIVEIKIMVCLIASGASFQNAFALQLDSISPEYIESVKGIHVNTNNLFKYESNGLESNQEFANCIIFDNFYLLMKHPGKGTGINTDPEAPFVPYDTLDITINFAKPVPIKKLPVESFNFYLIPNVKSDIRGKEVHLPDYIPSSLIDRQYFGTKSDISGTKKPDSEAINYFRTGGNLPWAIQIIQGFDYPIEKEAVNNGYNYFIEWAESKGEKRKDWYRDIENYRIKEKIYPHKK